MQLRFMLYMQLDFSAVSLIVISFVPFVFSFGLYFLKQQILNNGLLQHDGFHGLLRADAKHGQS